MLDPKQDKKNLRDNSGETLLLQLISEAIEEIVPFDKILALPDGRHNI